MPTLKNSSNYLGHAILPSKNLRTLSRRCPCLHGQPNLGQIKSFVGTQTTEYGGSDGLG